MNFKINYLQFFYFCIFFSLSVSPAHSALESRLAGLAIYDSERDITWLSNASLSVTETFGVAGINANGSMNWDTTVLWIAAMNIDGGTGYLGLTGWRLPVSVFPDSGCSIDGSGNVLIAGFGCTNSELDHLVYDELGGMANQPLSTSIHPNMALFSGIQDFNNWTSTEFAPDNGSAWHLNTFFNGLLAGLKEHNGYVWPIQDGDVFPTLLRCDLNDNGEVDSSDLQQVLQMTLGNIPDNLDCDINNNGLGDDVISINDFLIVLQIVQGFTPAINN